MVLNSVDPAERQSITIATPPPYWELPHEETFASRNLQREFHLGWIFTQKEWESCPNNVALGSSSESATHFDEDFRACDIDTFVPIQSSETGFLTLREIVAILSVHFIIQDVCLQYLNDHCQLQHCVVNLVKVGHLPPVCQEQKVYLKPMKTSFMMMQTTYTS